MHSQAYVRMSEIIDAIPGNNLTCLDVGSYNVNGTYRPLVEDRGWQYVGLDLTAGPNVDIVTEHPYRFPLADAMFDVVISGSTMEHVKAIWLWLPELVRVLKPGGTLAIITHWQFVEHRFPVDCWRILPDGMRYLFDLCGDLEDYSIRIYNATDISGVAVKRGAA